LTETKSSFFCRLSVSCSFIVFINSKRRVMQL